jgi:T5SS/PEP-CTERM-associated repeat protein
LAEVSIQGSNSLIDADVRLVVGDRGPAKLTVEQGATIRTPELQIGAGADGDGEVLLDGAGTELAPSDTGNTLIVGVRGKGTLHVQNGAVVDYSLVQVPDTGLAIGSETDSDGRILVSGAGSALKFLDSSQANVDFRPLIMSKATGGKAYLELKDSAKAEFGTGYIGVNAPFITGAQAASIRVDQGELSFGYSTGDVAQDVLADVGFILGREGSLEIINGGKVTSRTTGMVGDVGRRATALIDGSGSTWKAEALFLVGNNNGPVLNVTNGGEVNATSLQIGVRGTIEVSSAGKLVTTSAHVGAAMEPVSAVVTIRGATSTWTTQTLTIGSGTDTPDSGLVRVRDGGVITANLVTVNKGGTITGNGTLNVPPGGLVNNGGNVFMNGSAMPGNSPGKLTIVGNYVQGETGVLEIEVGGLQPESQYDRLAVTGNIQLGGTLRLAFVDGFLPQAGDTFDFLNVSGQLSGQFADVQLAGIMPNWQYQFQQIGDMLQLRSLTAAVPRQAGDFNADGFVNGADLALWKGGFGARSAIQSQGDADGDRDVDGADFLVWQRQLGTSASTLAATAVPEPASCPMVLLVILSLILSRRL